MPPAMEEGFGVFSAFGLGFVDFRVFRLKGKVKDFGFRVLGFWGLGPCCVLPDFPRPETYIQCIKSSPTL